MTAGASRHRAYFEIEAPSYRALGQAQGELFGDFLAATVAEERKSKGWKGLVHQSQIYLAPARRELPHLVEELEGYAEAAGVPVDELWALSLGDELDQDEDHCTTVVTSSTDSGALLVAHNEDWDREARDAICVLKKTVGDLTILELFYQNTLGGNSLSINSHGMAQAINTLTHRDWRVGVPRDIVARWMSETDDPGRDFQRLRGMERASGYNHNMVRQDGRMWNIECTAREATLVRPELPFVHTNHFRGELARLEAEDDRFGSFTRLRQAELGVQETMTREELLELMGDRSHGPEKSLLNERTIARALLEPERMELHVWLLREAEKGWVSYAIDFTG